MVVLSPQQLGCGTDEACSMAYETRVQCEDLSILYIEYYNTITDYNHLLYLILPIYPISH